MPYIQKLTPPPNRILEFSLRNFVGGLNNRSEQLQVNETPNVLNMRFVDETVMQRRNGAEYVDELVLNAPITFMDEFKPYQDTDKFVRATDSEVYLDSVKLCDVAGRINGTNFMGKYFFVDGKKLRVYGKFGQETTTYEKIIGTAVDDYVLMEVVNPPESYTPLGTEHKEGVLNVDYTNKKIWYEPCQLEKEDSYMGANVLPEKARYVVVHGGRLFVSGNDKDDDNVFISDIDNPYYFAVTLPLQLPPNSDKVSGLIVFDDSVLVARHHDLYSIIGATNNPNLGFEVFKLRKINSHTGFANDGAVSIAHNYLFFLGTDGNMYSLSSTRNDEKILSTTIISKTIDIERSPVDLTLDDVKEACSIFYRDEWYVSMKDKVLVYSYRHRAWTLYNNLNITSFYNQNYTLIWGNEAGRVCKFSEEYLDLDMPYESYWYSKWFDMDETSTYKQFRDFFIVTHTFKKFISDINIQFEIDYADVYNESTVKTMVSIWGKAKWGDRFINRDISPSLPITIGRRGRLIRFKFSNGYFEHGEVATYDDLQYYPVKQNGTLVKVLDEDVYYVWDVDEGYDAHWERKTLQDLNQAMKIYQVNGSYELRGKR